MLPRCFVSARCWRTIVRELDRTAPDEAVLVPLVALDPRDPEANPCAPLTLDALAEVVIAAVVLVPPELQVNRAARVSVRADTDRVMNRRIERLVGRFPRLRTGAYLHSHPFAHGWTRPSRGAGCDDQGHMIPLLERNQEAGLEASFSFIACRDRTGEAWTLRAFAMDARREIVDLGRVVVLPDEAAPVRAALAPGLWRRAETRAALERWRRELDRRALPCAVDDLFDGWVRCVVTVDAGTRLVLLVPVELPVRLPLLFRVDRRTGATRRVPLAGPAPEDWVRAVDAHREVERVGP